MFGEVLRKLRSEKHLTLDEASKYLGIHHTTLSAYERADRKPTIETLRTISNFYEVSTDYLLGLTEDRNVKKVESNAYEYLNRGNLNWNGIPLTDEELKPIKDILEVVVRDRMPKKINDEKKSNQKEEHYIL